MKCENAQMRRGHSISERELQPTRADGDTAARVVAIDSDLGSERLELHVTRYEPGRSLPLSLEGMQEILYTVSGRGKLFVDGEPHELEARTGAYVAAGESYEVENPGPDELLLVSATAPNENGAPPVGRRIVRYDDQPSLPASGDREFRYLVTDEVGCRDLTQFFGDRPGPRAGPQPRLRRGDLRARGRGHAAHRRRARARGRRHVHPPAPAAGAFPREQRRGADEGRRGLPSRGRSRFACV